MGGAQSGWLGGGTEHLTGSRTCLLSPAPPRADGQAGSRCPGCSGPWTPSHKRRAGRGSDTEQPRAGSCSVRGKHPRLLSSLRSGQGHHGAPCQVPRSSPQEAPGAPAGTDRPVCPPPPPGPVPQLHGVLLVRDAQREARQRHRRGPQDAPLSR